MLSEELVRAWNDKEVHSVGEIVASIVGRVLRTVLAAFVFALVFKAVCL